MLGSAVKVKTKYYPETLLEESKEKNTKMKSFINDELEVSSSDHENDKDSNNKANNEPSNEIDNESDNGKKVKTVF